MAKQISFLLLLLSLGLFYGLIEAMYVIPPCNDANWYCRYKSRADECNKTDECFPPKDDVKIKKIDTLGDSGLITSDHTFYNGAG